MSWHLAMVYPPRAAYTPLWFWADHMPPAPSLIYAEYTLDNRFLRWGERSPRVAAWEHGHPYYGRTKTR
jgi:hypothetical protein